MLKLHLDYSIYLDLIQKQPKNLFSDDKEFRRLWNELWSFIESGCDIRLFNVPEDLNLEQLRCLTYLSEGRGDSNCSIEQKMKIPHKFKFSQDDYFQSILLIDEKHEESKLKLVKNNQFPIAFLDNYLELFGKLIFVTQPKGRSVRKDKGNFNSWNEILLYLHFMSDVVIADNYLFSDPSLLVSNFHELIKNIYKKELNLNITLVTFNNPKTPFDLENLQINIKSILNSMGLKEKFNLILLNSELKEHDRGIFTNLVRIKSGDSFNFFNSKGELITKGTELDFYSLTNPVYFKMTEIALDAIKDAINKSKPTMKKITIQNRLLSIK
jgi:hypothetical protein